jgi:hypothetical protein
MRVGRLVTGLRIRSNRRKGSGQVNGCILDLFFVVDEIKFSACLLTCDGLVAVKPPSSSTSRNKANMASRESGSLLVPVISAGFSSRRAKACWAV